MKYIRHFIQWFVRWFWQKPTEIKPLMATDVASDYVCFKYKGQYVNIRKSEIPWWNSLRSSGKRKIMLKFRNLQKKGKIKFIKINGVMVCVKNKNYAAKKDDRE